MKILTTGATGNLGSKVVEALLKTVPASDLAVSVRNPEKAAHLSERGIDVRQGDFDYPETLDKAFEGIDRLLIISADGDDETRIKQHTNAVEAAERAGVNFIAYTSLANATESTNLMAPPHVATENLIRKTGISYSILRNNWYLENEIGSIQGAMNGAPWVTAAGDGKVGYALQQDYADAAASVLVGEGHENTIYELSAPLVTQEDVAGTLSNVLEKEVPVQHVNDEEYEQIMKEQGLPESVLPLVVEIQRSIRRGSLAIESNDFEAVLGRPVTPIDQALKQLVNDISQSN